MPKTFEGKPHPGNPDEEPTEKIDLERFTAPSQEGPIQANQGVVSGEISGTPDDVVADEESAEDTLNMPVVIDEEEKGWMERERQLAELEPRFAADAELGKIWDETAGMEDPAERAGALIDRMLLHRHKIERSSTLSVEESTRVRTISGLINRLRKLLP